MVNAAYGASSFATRHNVLQVLLTVRQESSESVLGFIAQAKEALHFLQLTRPPSAPVPTPVPGTGPLYSLEDSDHKLLISVLLHGTCYSTLTTSLLAQSKLTVQQVEDALKNEEAHQVGAATAVAAATAAAATAVPSGSQTAAPASSLVCAFCEG